MKKELDDVVNKKLVSAIAELRVAKMVELYGDGDPLKFSYWLRGVDIKHVVEGEKRDRAIYEETYLAESPAKEEEEINNE